MSLLFKPGRLLVAAVSAVAVLAMANSAGAWGAAGHRMIGYLAVKTLPDDVPGFVRRAAHDVGELAREPDRTKGSGKLHDEYREGNHFIDLDDAGLAMGGPSIDALPPTRQLYDDALRQADSTLSKAGWLPYAIADAQADLTTDFALWRIARVGERKAKSGARRAWFAREVTPYVPDAWINESVRDDADGVRTHEHVPAAQAADVQRQLAHDRSSHRSSPLPLIYAGV